MAVLTGKGYKMQLQSIQNDNFNPTFSAKLKLSGRIADISKETIAMWEKRAGNIASDKDLISLHFGTFMKERGDVYKNGKFYPWYASFRAIYASAVIKGKKVFDKMYIGYRLLNQSHSSAVRDAKVEEFFNKFKHHKIS